MKTNNDLETKKDKKVIKSDAEKVETKKEIAFFVNPALFNVDIQTAKSVDSLFIEDLNKINELKNKFDEVKLLDKEDPKSAVKCKELRLEYVRIRSSVDKTHKNRKRSIIDEGKFVDKYKNDLSELCSKNEAELVEIEKYQEQKEKDRLAELQKQRADLIRPFMPECDSVDLASYDQDLFDGLLMLKEKQYKQRVAEQEKEAKEKAEQEEKFLKRQQLRQSRISTLTPVWNFLSTEEQFSAFEDLSEEDFNALLTKATDAKKVKDDELAEIEKNAQILRQQNEEKQQKLKQEELKRKEAEKKLNTLQTSIKKEEEQKQAVIQKRESSTIEDRIVMWVDEFKEPDWFIDHPKTKEILQKFENFKVWARKEAKGLNQKK